MSHSHLVVFFTRLFATHVKDLPSSTICNLLPVSRFEGLLHYRSTCVHLALDTLPYCSYTMSKTVAVVAPSNLEAGYQFQATAEGKTFMGEFCRRMDVMLRRISRVFSLTSDV
jgi:hypothetical protein